MLTYGDGVADVDLARPARASTVARTGSRRSRRCGPPARFGGLAFDGDLRRGVHREAADRRGLDQRRLLRLRAGVFDYLDGDECVLEARRRSSGWRADGQLAAYRHDGFWQCMDTLRDKRLLEALWAERRAPWKVW